MRRLLPLAAASLMLSATNGFAESFPVQKDCETRSGPFVTGDYLYWQMQESNLRTALFVSQIGPFGGLPPEIKVLYQDPTWGSGFRVGVGYHLPYDQWDLSLGWTHFNHGGTTHVNTHGSLETGTDLLIALPLLGLANNSIVLFATQVSSHWSLAFNMLNLELGRRFSFGKKISIYPHGGLQGGWIEQSQNFAYEELSSGGGGPLFSITARNQNDAALIGPVMGLESRWRLGKEIGLFGDAAFSLLYGFFDIDNSIDASSLLNMLGSQIFTLTDSDLSMSTNRLIASQHATVPMTRVLLGLDWVHCFRGWILARVAVAYELQYWWNQWRYNLSPYGAQYGVGNKSGDLMFQGLTIEFGIGF